ncbi:Veg family protein [Oceanirhabdus sp. W0125-5]|uniref:Veg family protein n=1 Tax=Oceanirhabdus sp. W0125-5 TaxID=2999116 RepID=UPI0022F2B489|nr:Veg family protein [Oceanirhabdus sp. W0125-5]WBW99711.1 Veg family protein [Oceanirhabdus sp. W0125-5]
MKTLSSIKEEIENHVGEKIVLRDSGGRRKVFVKNGVIEKTYNSIFVIKLDDSNDRRISYSYSDVLTKTVQIVYAS